jgi:ASPIC and UnbV/FG-GAP-like repeat
MSKKIAVLAVFFSVAVAILFSAHDDIKPSLVRIMASESKWFVEDKLPLDHIEQIFDMGIVDANHDGLLDIYTSNHNYRQILWLADGHGGYRDSVTQWGLDQIKGFPGWEQSMQPPPIDKNGLYVYWIGDSINIQAHDAAQPVHLKLHIFSTLEVNRNEGFQIEQFTSKPLNEIVTETSLALLVPKNGLLSLYVSTRGGPVTFSFDKAQPLSQVYIGSQRVTPNSNSISLSLLDRHAIAWADFNDDGQLDLFISRGALGGSLRDFPDYVKANVKDELLVSNLGKPQFTDVTRAVGIEKKDCSGRHAKWVDFNQDGRLDLFVNCLDRGNVPGTYNKQLYEQTADKKFVEVAAKVGLDLPKQQLIDFAWLDVNNDGHLDLVTHEDTGYYIYRNQGGKFVREFVYRAKFERGDVPKLKGDTFDYWQFDGKMSFGDFENDGYSDIFVASKKGNVLLINKGGKYTAVDPATYGLPTTSVAAAWVDYDNDGRLDLFTVPDGLFHQGPNHKFERTNLLVLRPNKYQAAIANWYDKNNDGSMDLLLALEDNASLWRWWEKPFKHKDVKTGKDDRFSWQILNYRNIGPVGHWLELNLAGLDGNRQAIGARVTITTPEGHQTQTVGASEGAYLSQGHYRLYFGLGNLETVPDIKINWPTGKTQELHDVKVNQVLTVNQAG